jgi:hypothetical protein
MYILRWAASSSSAPGKLKNGYSLGDDFIVDSDGDEDDHHEEYSREEGTQRRGRDPHVIHKSVNKPQSEDEGGEASEASWLDLAQASIFESKLLKVRSGSSCTTF